VLKRESELYKINDNQVDEEKARIDKAIDDVRQSLTIDAKQIESKLGKQSADTCLEDILPPEPEQEPNKSNNTNSGDSDRS